ncbi:FtsW/RodA/SpoVE family cell cycle protein [Capnocytophaga catalasegens]|uniref:Probable peptidoglycan glycosyltransferase FtsW n=1 Tax=Capnocytophaga catalasegens TaxID=1004260 RepID=A0AAV5AS38_9FLAO|nr:FtsW/RodA/SpoVE family cell cycle protein [Capnocytophaga catalasegens]GIZ15740.1 cell division protein FtsW [Capnocytophaga catalasegens]GJM50127.1 cell division protein FtsW [Capnocytophaga catalasegens]GJM53048.1 cell division protein FtsW [Capnocytophaga catalasegens]
MQFISKYLKGDLALWGIIFLFAFISFLPVYSASSNLTYVVGKGTPSEYLARHFILILCGLAIIFVVHRFPYRFFRPISRIGIMISIILLFVALMKGTTIEGANASRWLYIFGISFQPSALALIFLMMYVASYLADNYNNQITFQGSFYALWLPTFIIVGLVVIANLSTGVIIFSMVLTLVIIGKYPIKYLFNIGMIGALLMTLFVLTAKAFPDAFPNRVDTWISRIENFISDNPDDKDTYQIDHSKMAIASGGLTGVGAGKSVMKHFLPQSSSDFIFAIIIEEFGIVIGGIGLILLYCMMLLRIIVISHKASTIFGKLLVLGAGLPVVFQAFVNMGVSVGLLPVTGQTLPFITSGGTSIWMTCLSMGIILSVSAREQSKTKNTNTHIKRKQPTHTDQGEDISSENNLARETIEEIALQD